MSGKAKSQDDIVVIGIEDRSKPIASMQLNTNLKRDIGALTMLALCFNICSSWAGLSTSIQIALLQGGPLALIYGVLVVTVVYLCIGLTIAELASVYPTAGGQYHFTSILAPAAINRSLSYACGFITNFYWIATEAAVQTITAEQVLTLATWYNPGFPGRPWQLFLIYQALGVVVVLYNVFALKRLPVTHHIGFFLNVALALTLFIGLLARSSPKASGKFVWGTFINETGWPDGVCFISSLLTGCFMYGGLDGSLHLAEEAENPRRVVPRVCVGVVLIGFCTAFPFAIATMYSISDYDAILTSQWFIPFEIYRQGLRSDVAAIVLLIAGVILGFLIANATLQTSSRVVWAFARDEGIAFSRFFSTVHPVLQIPVWATLLNWAVCAAIGCLILASSVAFDAIIASSVVHQLLSMLIPIILLIYQRRSETYLPQDRKLALPNWIGWTVNTFSAVLMSIMVIFFAFPTFLPVTTSNMNYTVVVLGIVAFVGLANWFLYARHHYQGPRIEMQT